MRTIVGSIARGDQYYHRQNIRDKILSRLQCNENLLISAPRRTGKSSILLDLVDRPDERFYAVYIDTEALSSGEDFFKAVLQNLLDTDKIEKFGKFEKTIKESLKDWAGQFSSIKLGPLSVDIKSNDRKSYHDLLNEFLSEIDLGEKRILLMIDEFPITIENISDTHGIPEALLFLSQCRAMRLNPGFKSKLSIIYSGSIGLYTAVRKISGTDKVNDLSEIQIPPLTETESVDLIHQLYGDEKEGVALSVEITAYILNKIQWWIPFYFQLLIRELSEIESMSPEEKDIDLAFDNVVQNGNIYFEHFKSRLMRVFKDTEKLKAVYEILLTMKSKLLLSDAQILNICEKYSVRNDMEEILNVLMHDGYIVKEVDGNYKFYSPILMQWWK
jgi:AAA+ ATPase superfamily predicted ATPase